MLRATDHLDVKMLIGGVLLKTKKNKEDSDDYLWLLF